ncbi:hypothetical protein [Microbulbifer epialgicus]|uniref:Uncharacterized protein n=1 Tax=Microbulbifer epialgicus TaxID=393907 RepID=A0ABV4P4H3_9GAMM
MCIPSTGIADVTWDFLEAGQEAQSGDRSVHIFFKINKLAGITNILPAACWTMKSCKRLPRITLNYSALRVIVGIEVQLAVTIRYFQSR